MSVNFCKQEKQKEYQSIVVIFFVFFIFKGGNYSFSKIVVKKRTLRLFFQIVSNAQTKVQNRRVGNYPWEM